MNFKHAQVPETSDVVIVGGGLIGTATAYFLSKEGVDVTLLEKGDLAVGASGASETGIFLSSKSPGLLSDLALESREMYSDLTNRFDRDIDFQEHGGMIVIGSEDQWEPMEEFVNKKRESGLELELLENQEARKRQPALAENIAGATYSSQDASVNPMYTTLAFAEEATRASATICTHSEVHDIVVRNGKIKAVQAEDGSISTNVVVNAAGAWAPLIGDMVDVDIPVKPRKGQIIVSEAVPELINSAILDSIYLTAKYGGDENDQPENPMSKFGIGLALTQTIEGNLLIGSSREFAGYNVGTSPEVLDIIVKHALELVPVIEDVHIIRAFAGLRPYTPDGVPVLGSVTDPEGFYVAAGHEGDGIALAPITGRIMADAIVEENEPYRDTMGPQRFW